MSAIEDFASDAVSIVRKGAIGTLWLDRPEKRNAMNPALWNGIIAGLDALEADGETRAIVLAGNEVHPRAGRRYDDRAEPDAQRDLDDDHDA